MKFTVLIVACLVLVGCFGRVLYPSAQPPTATESAAQFQIEWGQTLSATGCTLDYAWYRPAAAPVGELVVLAHGFLRNKARLDGLARALAATGLAVVTVDFCNTRLWRGNHARNGLDLIAVANQLNARRVVYAGFSAGGLAALVAAHADPRTLGVLTLDLVDAQGLGQRLAPQLQRPVIGLFGEPAACNAENNGVATLLAAPRAQIERINGASHCDFEAPTDWLCRAVCESEAAASGAAQRQAVILKRAVGVVRGFFNSILIPQPPSHS